MIPSTLQRVPENTAQHINEEILRHTEETVRRVVAAGSEAIDRRLHELAAEWDVERYVETLAPTLSLIGLGLGLTGNKKWLALPIVVQAFFLQHALQGWCPPIPVLRRLGIRTQAEIDEERYALKAARGDFRGVVPGEGWQALAAARQ